MADRPDTQFPRLAGDMKVDVVIIGSGITGVTVAHLLKEAGKKVALLEQSRVGSGETGHTSGHLTSILDTRFNTLEADFGREQAGRVYESNQVAIHQIQRTIEKFGIDCDFKQVPGYLYTVDQDQLNSLIDEVDACHRIGIPADVTVENPLPFQIHGALRFKNQAQFHPEKYVCGLAKTIPGDGSFVFEHSQAVKIEDGNPCCVITNHGSVCADKVVVATHSASSGGAIMNTKVAAYRTYALAARLENGPKEAGLFWDLADPYHYIRKHNDLWIIGGEDHKTGTLENTNEAFERLELFVRSYFEVSSIPYQWSGQILEPIDGLPYIGLMPNSQNRYVATGFSGNGLTFGTVAGMLIKDLILHKVNSWTELFSPSRWTPLSSAKDYIIENKDFPLCLVRDRVQGADVASVDEIKCGQGATVQIDDKKLAVYRDEQAKLHAFSCSCPHMGCHVHWNQAERSWDCPCHGSRFDTHGKLLNGPSLKNLEPVPLADLIPAKDGRRSTTYLDL